MIQIDLAAFTHDMKSHMEELQTMNSYYHPRDHEHRHERHSHEAPLFRNRPIRYRGLRVRTLQGEEDHSQGASESQAHEGLPVDDKDLDVYRVLVAVERGELSPEDAARKLEELDESSRQADDAELI